METSEYHRRSRHLNGTPLVLLGIHASIENIESAQTHRARVCSLLTRASDTTLRHLGKAMSRRHAEIAIRTPSRLSWRLVLCVSSAAAQIPAPLASRPSVQSSTAPAVKFVDITQELGIWDGCGNGRL